MGWVILIMIGIIVLIVIIGIKDEQKKLHLCLLVRNRNILKKKNFVWQKRFMKEIIKLNMGQLIQRWFVHIASPLEKLGQKKLNKRKELVVVKPQPQF